jgi:DNA-binding transcriptional regulator GbsR (MarR family)
MFYLFFLNLFNKKIKRNIFRNRIHHLTIKNQHEDKDENKDEHHNYNYHKFDKITLKILNSQELLNDDIIFIETLNNKKLLEIIRLYNIVTQYLSDIIKDNKLKNI